MTAETLLLAHCAATWALIGLIWNVQLVQYPAFLLVGATEFARYHEAHCRRITWIVGPLMGIELLTGAALWWERPAGFTDLLAAGGLVLIAVNWLATAFVAVPLHGRASGRDEAVRRALVRTNWIRTVAWTLRGGIVTYALVVSMRAT